MKTTERFLKLAATLLCASSLLGNAAQAAAPTTGLVAYHPFDGHANDASGNQLNGIAFNTTTTTDRAGNPDGALLFDGATSYVDLGNRIQWNFNGSFSISAWVKLTGGQPEKYIVAKYDVGNSTNAYGMGTTGGSGAYSFLKGDPATFQEAFGGPPLSDGKWHMLTMTYSDQSGLGLFVDGGQVGFFSRINYPPFADNTPLLIGRAFTGQFFGGAIDEVRIYNRALSGAEIAEMGPPPEINITLQPLSGYTTIGNFVTLRTTATATAGYPISYQWFKNDQTIPDATNSTLLRLTRDTAGVDRYKVRLTAGPTIAFSNEATLEFAMPTPAALLAHYSFDSGDATIIDETSHFHGQAVNTEYVPGRVGTRALRFNGTNAFVRIPYPASPLDLAGTPYTIAFWMKPEPKVSAVIWMGDSDNHGGYNFTLQTFSASWLHGSGGDNPLQLSYRANTNWIHVAMVWNGIQRTFYTNGAISTKVATTNAIISERDDSLYFGSANGTNLFFRGTLDDIRIYNYALASDEIQQLSLAGPSTPLLITLQSNSLLLKWPYDPGTNYRLEFATELSPTAQWTPASGVSVRSGDIYTLTQPFDLTVKFFRLRKL